MEKRDGLGAVVTIQVSTEDEYGERVKMLTQRAEAFLGRQASLLEVIIYLGALHEEYRPASIRKYFAALTWAVDAAASRGELDGAGEGVHRDALACRPRARPKTDEPRTSAKKRKTFDKAELHRVCTYLLKRGKIEDKLLVLLLAHGVFLGLRPSEYSDADLQGALLVIRARKATNGRGLGEYRELDLSDSSAAELASLRRLIETFAAASQGELERLLDRLGARLRRACRSVGIEPIALYTTRHQFIANMKAARKTVAEIAAAAGHRGLRTAGRSYARSNAGWAHAATARASQAMIAKAEEKAAAPHHVFPPTFGPDSYGV
jgi:integrase